MASRKQKNKTTEKKAQIIQNFGLFWSRDDVFWGTPNKSGRLEGRKIGNKKNPTIDFRSQIGIYVLYGINRDVIYIGQAGSGENNRLYARLKQHTNDHLRNRWKYFSWFGFYKINKDGSVKETQTKQLKIKAILNDFEGILIKIVDPVVNKHDANFSNCIEYEQVPYTKINDYENAKMEKILKTLEIISKKVK